jgi:hypothetical protein
MGILQSIFHPPYYSDFKGVIYLTYASGPMPGVFTHSLARDTPNAKAQPRLKAGAERTL